MESTQVDWKYKLLDCCSAPYACLWSCFVPFGIGCQQGTTAKLMLPEQDAYVKACLFASFLICYGVAYNRSRIREKLNIRGRYLEDCWVSCLLPCCSMVVEWKEVMHNKGLHEDESIWQAYNAYSSI